MGDFIIESGAIWPLLFVAVFAIGSFIYNRFDKWKTAPKELPPTYSIDNIVFNEYSRVARITIIETTKYRTIEKYKQVNYKKYPVYSRY